MAFSPMQLISYQNDWARRILANDGKQTPFKGHPVFVAQHATATCCRGCLAKWHGIGKGRPLRPAELTHVTAVIERWLRKQSVEVHADPAQGRLL